MLAAVTSDPAAVQGCTAQSLGGRCATCQPPAIVRQVPSAADFSEAVRIGLGWGMLPECSPSRRPAPT